MHETLVSFERLGNIQKMSRKSFTTLKFSKVPVSAYLPPGMSKVLSLMARNCCQSRLKGQFVFISLQQSVTVEM